MLNTNVPRCFPNVNPNQAPSCNDIARAAKMYTAGACSSDFRVAFPHLSENSLALLWIAAKLCDRQEDELPPTLRGG